MSKFYFTDPRIQKEDERLKLGVSLTQDLKDCIDQQSFEKFILSAQFNIYGWRFVEWLGYIPGISQYCDGDMIYASKTLRPILPNEVFQSFRGDRVSYDVKNKECFMREGKGCENYQQQSTADFNDDDNVENNSYGHTDNTRGNDSKVHIQSVPGETSVILFTSTTNDLTRLAILIEVHVCCILNCVD